MFGIDFLDGEFRCFAAVTIEISTHTLDGLCGRVFGPWVLILARPKCRRLKPALLKFQIVPVLLYPKKWVYLPIAKNGGWVQTVFIHPIQ